MLLLVFVFVFVFVFDCYFTRYSISSAEIYIFVMDEGLFPKWNMLTSFEIPHFIQNHFYCNANLYDSAETATNIFH